MFKINLTFILSQQVPGRLVLKLFYKIFLRGPPTGLFFGNQSREKSATYMY